MAPAVAAIIIIKNGHGVRWACVEQQLLQGIQAGFLARGA